MDSEQIFFDFAGTNICRSRILDSRNSAARPKGVRTTDGVTTKRKMERIVLSGATARFRIPAVFSSISFLPRQKRYGPRSGGDGAAYRTVLSAHTKWAAGGTPRHSGAEKTPTEAEEIGREGQNLHNLQKSTLDNERKIRMIILSHNRSTGRREKNRPV